MSSLLEQAIIDATALKEAAMKTAEKNLVEKYSSKIKEAVDKLLEQDLNVEQPVDAPAVDAASGLENVPTDLAPNMAEPEVQKDPLEKVKPSYLKGKGDDELITIDFSSLKAKPVDMAQAGGMLPVAPVMPMNSPVTPAPAASPAAPAAPLAEGIQPYEEDEGEIMAEDDSIGELDNDTHASPVTEENEEPMLELDLNEAGCGDGMEEGDCMEEGGYPADGMGGEPLGAGAMYREEEEQEENTMPSDTMEEEIPLEEELVVDMDVVSDGWRGMQPNEKREQMNVALAKEQDEEYQRQMKEYEEALEASEQRIKKTSTKNKALVKENEELKNMLMSLKEHVEKMNISNAKLLYMNRILGNPSYNERQKEQIVESISRTDSVEAAKIAYETLQSAVGSQRQEVKAPKSLNEAVSRSTSPFLVKPRNTQENPQSDRMKVLAGIIKK